MISIRFRIKSSTGVAVRITEDLRDINIQHHKFWVKTMGFWIFKWKVGRMLIVVRDEDSKKAIERIKETSDKYCLGVTRLKTFFWVKICLENKKGELNAVLWKLANRDIDLDYSESVDTLFEGNPPEEKKVVLFIFNCPDVNYAAAKNLLGSCGRIMNEPAFVPPILLDPGSRASLRM